MYRPQRGRAAGKAASRFSLACLIICAFLALACGVPMSAAQLTATPTGTSTPVVLGTPAASAAERNAQVLSLVNAYRASKGLNPLKLNAALSGVATNYAHYMSTAGFFGHDAPNGSTPNSRIVSS